MQVQEINVIKCDRKTSSKGQEYLSLVTDLGKMSCWQGHLFSKIQAGHRYLVDTEVKNNYTNVMEVREDYGVSPSGVKALEPFKEAREDKAHLMILSYAKDLVVAGINYGAQRGIDLDQNSLWELAYKNITDAYKKLREEFK